MLPNGLYTCTQGNINALYHTTVHNWGAKNPKPEFLVKKLEDGVEAHNMFFVAIPKSP